MKTSVPMIRKMGNYEIVQRTKDSYFSASSLLKQWNKSIGNADLRINKFLYQVKTKEFIDALSEQVNEENQPIPENQLVIETKAKTSKNGKRIPGEVWMHPYLFIKFAMWLNPKFEVKVIKFVYDNLMDNRNQAGDNYIGLSNSVQRLYNCDYRRMAKGLNWIVFNRHKNGIRQEATPEQLQELIDLQKKLAFAIDMGYIRTFDELINEMQRMYHLKHPNS